MVCYKIRDLLTPPFGSNSKLFFLVSIVVSMAYTLLTKIEEAWSCQVFQHHMLQHWSAISKLYSITSCSEVQYFHRTTEF